MCGMKSLILSPNPTVQPLEIIYQFSNLNGTTVEVWGWIDKLFKPTVYRACDYSSMPGSKVKHIIKGATELAPWGQTLGIQIVMMLHCFFPCWYDISFHRSGYNGGPLERSVTMTQWLTRWRLHNVLRYRAAKLMLHWLINNSTCLHD